MGRKIVINIGLKKTVLEMLDDMAKSSERSRPEVIEQLIMVSYKRFQRQRAVADIDRDMGVDKKDGSQ